MTISKARQLALQLMSKHGLLDKGWTFEFNNTKRAAGQCLSGRRNIIFLSKYFLPVLTDEKIKDVILHEIAHALVGNYNGHNHVWRAKCREIGAIPEECFDLAANSIEGASEILVTQSKYTLTCPKCGKKSPLHRKPKRNRSCGDCYPYGFSRDHQLVVTQNY